MRIEPHELPLHCMATATMHGLPSSMHTLTAWRILRQERSARWGGALQRRLVPAVDGVHRHKVRQCVEACSLGVVCLRVRVCGVACQQ